MDLLGIKRRKKIRDFNQEVNIAIAQELSYFGEATAQHFISHSELVKISQSKIHPDFSDTNYQQQAGFSAEVKQVARTNAENIINHDGTRIARTDNVGAVNHPQFDLVAVDKNNNPILDANGQYVGGTQQKNFSKVENYNKLIGRDYEHYKNAKFAVPPDQYDEIMANWDSTIQNYKKQSEYLRANGNTQQAEVLDKRIEKIQDVKSRTFKSKVSTDDAMEARKSPLRSTVKDISRVSHRAGIQAAKAGAAISGTISVAQNIVDIVNEDKEIEDALLDVAADIGKAGAKAYVIGAGSSVVGGALKSASSQVCKNLSKGGGPAAIINTGGILAKNTIALISGELSGEEFITNIGQEGTTLAASMTGANLGASLGTIIMPGVGSIVGGVIGGMIASMLSGSMFRELQLSIAETKLSNERRKIISEVCAKLKAQEKQYRDMVNDCLEYFLDYKEDQIRNSFAIISQAIENGTSIESGLAQLGDAFGKKIAFATNEDFKKHIEQGNTLKL
jgi:hypothetical protein